MLARIVLFQPKQSCIGFLCEDERVKLRVRMRADELQKLLCGFVACDGLKAGGGETLRKHFGWL